MGDLFSSQTEIPWLNSYATSWNKIIQNNKTPHAILISGNTPTSEIDLPDGK